jgi:carbohydrate-selective porin OprB
MMISPMFRPAHNYQVQLAPWLMLQPVFQYYSNVGGRNKGAAGVAGFRMQTTF